jgi:DNA polymerase-3 subunit alpha
LEIQKQCAEGTVEIANRAGLPLVATCDTHYLCGGDAEAHEVLLCINTGKTMSDPRRMQYGSKEFYLKSPAEMYEAFPDRHEAVKRSQLIADMVDIDLDFKTRYFPVFAPPAGKTDRAFLRELCEQALDARFPDDGSAESAERRQTARDRLEMELDVICRQGYASYFLIVWDFVRFASENGIACGARGSACGALVSYLLGFSNVDPIEYDLLFERFLDPNRAKAPDIDIDFDQHRREEVIEYVRKKYGADRVSQIITFNTLGARAVLKDVARALEIPLAQVDGLTKLVPARPGITLEKALAEVHELRAQIDRSPDFQRLFGIAAKLEGLARNPGVHAAGVVVGDRPLTEYVPLQKNGEQLVTQWEMGVLEKIGALKFDFLGLRNLTLLTSAVRVIEQSRGEKLDLLSLPLDDAKTFQLLQRGETKGVFQLESEGIRNLLVKMKPDSFHDIIAVAALYRPGPLGGGMVDDYIDVKHGRKRAEYAHPILKDVLAETYGVMVYQEQVMRILNRLGGIDLADSYLCIKAIGAKKLENIAPYKEKFIAGSKEKGLSADKAKHIFELIEYFAGYGFNKSHSTAYALIAYQTAYLKAHYSAEFMTALLSSETDKTDLLVEHIEDCRRIGLDVRPPDVNEGEVRFGVSGKVIRFGLSAIKGVGEKAVEAVVAARKSGGKFRDIYDFCDRVDHRLAPKATVESLVKAGAFDSLGAKRRQLFEVLPTAYQAGVSARIDKEAGQGMLFGGKDDADAAPATGPLPDVPEWSDTEKLAFEKSLLGIYLSSHPLLNHESQLRLYRTHALADLAGLPPKKEVVIAGMVSGVRTLVQKRGRNANQRYARFNLEDLGGSVSCVMFADAFALYGGHIVNEAVVFLKAQVDASLGAAAPTADGENAPESVSVIVNEVIRLEDAAQQLSGNMLVRLDGNRCTPEDAERLANLLRTKPGASNVYVDVDTPDGLRVRLRTADNVKVACDGELVRMLEDAFGAGCVQIAPRVNGSNGKNGKSNGNGRIHGGRS